MPLLSKSELNGIVGSAYKSATFSESLRKSMQVERAEGATKSLQKYDIFLSHSYLDKDTILQLNYLLEEILHLEVFVDWIEKPELDRDSVTPETAAEIRSAMDRSAALLYAYSVNAYESKWMPWELGYSDAKHGRVAVLPMTNIVTEYEKYEGSEYVGLYPFVRIGDALNGKRF